MSKLVMIVLSITCMLSADEFERYLKEELETIQEYKSFFPAPQSELDLQQWYFLLGEEAQTLRILQEYQKKSNIVIRR